MYFYLCTSFLFILDSIPIIIEPKHIKPKKTIYLAHYHELHYNSLHKLVISS